MTSPVNWTILGLVIERPSYGLELANRFQRVYADVLPLSGDSHVYSALNMLQAREMIEIFSRTKVDRQPKPHYRATQLGRRNYENWLIEQIDAQSRTQELWVRQLAIFAHDPSAALQMLDRYERGYLKEAGGAGYRPAGSGLDSREELIDGLVAEQQRVAVGGMLSWLRYAHARFEAFARSAGGDEPPRA
jgi:DNA-binding PadR family transcriptional regulator